MANAPDPCPFCKEIPAIHRHAKSPAFYAVECVSKACTMRIVKTHNCGSEAEAVRIWNERVT